MSLPTSPRPKKKQISFEFFLQTEEGMPCFEQSTIYSPSSSLPAIEENSPLARNSLSKTENDSKSSPPRVTPTKTISCRTTNKFSPKNQPLTRNSSPRNTTPTKNCPCSGKFVPRNHSTN